MTHVSTNLQRADMLTKGLQVAKFIANRESLMVMSIVTQTGQAQLPMDYQRQE